MKLQRLRGRKVCDRVLDRGNVWKSKTMLIRWLSGPPRHPAVDPTKPAIYIGTLASTKLDKSAVKRNRMRRRCREAFRTSILHSQSSILHSLQLLILPRSSSLSAPFGEIQTDARNFLAHVTHG